MGIGREIDMRDVCDRLGLELRGGRIRCPNPEHVESHADNCSVKQLRGGWWFSCFVCGAAGDSVELVRLFQGLKVREAFSWLRRQGLITEKAASSKSVRPSPTPASEDDYLAAVDQFLATGETIERIGALLAWHLTWERLGTPYRWRVNALYDFEAIRLRKNGDRDLDHYSSSRAMARWERTGEGFPEEAIERRLAAERSGYLA